MAYAPPFTASAKAIALVADISALIERHAIEHEQQDALRLRKANQIQTIQASLAIEGNTLSTLQVTDILEGRRVVAPLREIQEVKNALATYDLFPTLNPYAIKDLLVAHRTMMAGLVDEAGTFRHGGVGVFAGKKALLIAPPVAQVPILMRELFHWLKHAKDHLLIRSCVFHYEFEFIHPFADGNGRLGRLWQSLILSKLHPHFRYLPVETMIHHNQRRYYDAINKSSAMGDSGAFIDFMLEEILRALRLHQGTHTHSAKEVQQRILDYICQQPGARVKHIVDALRLSQRTVERHLRQLKLSAIDFRGAPRTGGYYPKSQNP